MLIRATLFFTNNLAGFTESWWREGASSDLASYGDLVTELANKRIKVSGKETYLPYARISQEGVFRDAYNLAFSGYGLRGTYAESSDAPATALVLRWSNSTHQKHKNSFLRGVWDSVVDTGGVFKPSGSFTGVLNAYAGEVLQKDWGWLGVDTSQKANISNVVQNSNGTVRITVANPIFPNTPGEKIRASVSGIDSPRNMNGAGIFNIVSTTVIDSVPKVSIFTYTTGGQVRYNTYALVTAKFCLPWKISERRTGRPSFGGVGRRRGRARS